VSGGSEAERVRKPILREDYNRVVGETGEQMSQNVEDERVCIPKRSIDCDHRNDPRVVMEGLRTKD